MTQALSKRELLAATFRIGCLSWGGGAATLAMLHDEFSVRRAAVPEDEFQLLFGLSRLVPGMNLLSLTVLIGHRVQGLPGALLALVGLTGPSFAIILLGCLLFRRYQIEPRVVGALAGLAAAVVALLAHTGWQLAAAALRKDRLPARAVWVLLAGVTAVVSFSGWVSPAWLVLGGGGLGGVLYAHLASRTGSP